MNCSLLFSRSYRKAASTLKGTGGGGGSRTRVYAVKGRRPGGLQELRGRGRQMF
jgi:hypothetical protein